MQRCLLNVSPHHVGSHDRSNQDALQLPDRTSVPDYSLATMVCILQVRPMIPIFPNTIQKASPAAATPRRATIMQMSPPAYARF